MFRKFHFFFAHVENKRYYTSSQFTRQIQYNIIRLYTGFSATPVKVEI